MPKKQNFQLKITYNELLKKWTAIDNIDFQNIGYGDTSDEAFIDYLKQTL